MPLPIDAAIQRYLQHCLIEGKTGQTRRAYAWSLARFLRRLPDPSGPLEAIDTAVVLDYLAADAHLKPATRHRYFREVRRFFQWAIEQGLLERSPFAGLRNVRVPEQIVEPFRPAEIAALLASCAGATPAERRDHAILLTLLDTGLRCSELVQLELRDADWHQRRLRVRFAKGQKQRVVPFAERCADALAAYCAERGDAPGALFVACTRHGALRPAVALQPNGLKQLLRRRGRQAGVARVHAHRFRHTFATWAIAHDARELDVQYLLGHSSPDMVRRYTATYRSEQAALRHAAFSPADGMPLAAAGGA